MNRRLAKHRLQGREAGVAAQHEHAVDRVLTDRGTEYFGAHDRHEYALYLGSRISDHTRTKAKSPQTNGICERFRKTLLDEFYRVAFCKRLYHSIDTSPRGS